MNAPNKNPGSRFVFDRTVVGTVATGLGGQLALVVSGVLVARALGPADRGQFALMVAIAISASYIVALGTPTAVAFAIARDESPRAVLIALRRWAIAQLFVVFAISALALGLVVATHGNSRVIALLFLPSAAVALISLYYGLAVLQGLSRFLAFNILRLLPATGYSIGVVALVLAGETTIDAFVIALSVTNVIAAAAVATTVLRSLPPATAAAVDQRALVTYGLKAQIGTTSALETFQIDQLIVGAIAGPLALGYYVIGTAFTNLPRFIAQSLGMVAFPRVAGQLAKGGAKAVARQAMLTTVIVAGGSIVVLELTLGWLVPFFFGAAFTKSIAIAQIMLISSFFMSLRRVLGDALRGVNKPLPASIAEVLAWVVYGVCVVPMTVTWGAKGAAAALVVAAFAGFLYIAVAARSVSRHMDA